MHAATMTGSGAPAAPAASDRPASSPVELDADDASPGAIPGPPDELEAAPGNARGPAEDPAARAWASAVDVERLLASAAPLVPLLALRVVRQISGRFQLVPESEVRRASAYAPGAVRPIVTACSVHPAGAGRIESVIGLGIRVRVPAEPSPSMFLVVDGQMMLVHERVDGADELPDGSAAWAHTAAHGGFHAWPSFREFALQSIARMDLPRIMLPPLSPGDLGAYALEWLARERRHAEHGAATNGANGTG